MKPLIATKPKKYRQEALNRWGEKEVAESENRIKKLGKEGWKHLKAECDEIYLAFAKFSDKHPGHPDVQDNVAMFREYLTAFYEVPIERLLELDAMYVTDERFRAFFEKYKPSLANFINEAIKYYDEEGLGGKER